MALESICGANFPSKCERFGGGRHGLNSVNFLQDDPLADPKFTVPAVEEVRVKKEYQNRKSFPLRARILTAKFHRLADR